MLFFGLLSDLVPAQALEAGRAVFGGQPVILSPKPIAMKPLKPTPEILMRKASRFLKLSGFRVSRSGVTDASVYKALRIDKADWYKWRRGELPDSSGKSQRIEKYLADSAKSPTSPTLRAYISPVP